MTNDRTIIGSTHQTNLNLPVEISETKAILHHLRNDNGESTGKTAKLNGKLEIVSQKLIVLCQSQEEKIKELEAHAKRLENDTRIQYAMRLAGQVAKLEEDLRIARGALEQFADFNAVEDECCNDYEKGSWFAFNFIAKKSKAVLSRLSQNQE